MSSPEQIRAIASVISIFVFIGLLILASILVYNIDLCDNHSCKAFIDAETVAEPNTKAYILSLVDSLGSDGFWPFAFLSATFVTFFLILAGVVVPTVESIWITWVFVFLIFYAVSNFFIHHYFNPIATYVGDYIENTIPDDTLLQTSKINDEAKRKFPKYMG